MMGPPALFTLGGAEPNPTTTTNECLSRNAEVSQSVIQSDLISLPGWLPSSLSTASSSSLLASTSLALDKVFLTVSMNWGLFQLFISMDNRFLHWGEISSFVCQILSTLSLFQKSLKDASIHFGDNLNLSFWYGPMGDFLPLRKTFKKLLHCDDF